MHFYQIFLGKVTKCWQAMVVQLVEQSGQISCQIQIPGGSMGPRYALQLLFSKK
jgi:hypothetical protein